MASDGTPNGDADHTREQGIEFGDLQAALADHDYPASRDELLAEYGAFELELSGGSTTLREILGKRHEDSGDIQYDSAEEVHRSVHNLVGSDAVGREEYTDRGGSQQVSDDVEREDSF